MERWRFIFFPAGRIQHKGDITVVYKAQRQTNFVYKLEFVAWESYLLIRPLWVERSFSVLGIGLMLRDF